MTTPWPRAYGRAHTAMRRRLEKHSGYDKAGAHKGHMFDVGITGTRRTHDRNTGAVKTELLMRPRAGVSPGRAGAQVMPSGHVRFWGKKAPSRSRLTSRTKF